MESAGAGRCALRGARRSRPGAVIATMRPKQWIKNALVIAAAGAAGALGHDDTPGRVIVACASFCLLASGIYAINDVSDAEEDRRHPRKRFRPVAAGELDPRVRDRSRPIAVARRASAMRRDRAAAGARRRRVRRAHAVLHARVAASDRVRHLRGGGRVRAARRGRRRRGACDAVALVPAGRDQLGGVRGRGQALRRAATDRRPGAIGEDACSTPTARGRSS